MSRVVAIFVVGLLILSACASSMDGSSQTTTLGATCSDPPETELEAASDLNLAVEPNPIEAGSVAMLSIERDGLAEDSVTGAGAAWKCWDGSTWVDTHQIVKGFDGRSGETIELGPGMTTTIPAVGLSIPSSYPIVIPDVPPGTYRIVDEVFEGGARITGFVLVEVLEADG